jgi:hypothetical protein
LDYYADHLEIEWFQVRGFGQPDSLMRIKVDHPENFIWSFDPIVRNADINAASLINLQSNWIGQLIFDPGSWTGVDATAVWESSIVDIGWGWKPESILSIHDDRRDFEYTTVIPYWRGANDYANVESESWSMVEKNSIIDASCQYVQVRVVYITTDSTLTFPLIKSIKLSKRWDAQTGFSIPTDELKYTDGLLDDVQQTGFWGIELSPLIDSTTPLDGWWTSPVHDFGLSLHPRWATWYALVPLGSYFDTLVGDSVSHIQIRGSNTEPISPWENNQLPQSDDPIWGDDGEIENSWVDIKDRDSIPELIGMVRYAQVRVKFGVNM